MNDAPHVPVLRDESLELLQPGPGRRLVDGTFGFGGHSRLMAEAGAEVLGLDLDAVAHAACLDLAGKYPGLCCQRISFRYLEQALKQQGWFRVDGVLLDLGVSSLQLDDPAKGFSYRADGPLDLRFNQDEGASAADIIAGLKEKELADLIYRYGEERGSRRIARALVRARDEAPVATTARLREIVEGVLPRGAKAAPVLSRVFQALRIAANAELEALEEVLQQLPRVLKPGGRFVIISYHSLEDRLVKRFIDREKKDCLCPPELPVCACDHKARLRPLTRRAVKASPAEEKSNPRSRSARLRAAQIL
ncbi:16S rRNA (cytosine(1402)-N(4))-methyltransferase [bacterium DOLJORAL78_65_58]|nr:MAG: 16S rRNA (cytosine(1402)-N(4))-methyltransferase [bacterium DOLZORAL124_64_63]PIE75904.1 MAG: 16S rRNA (cytosine(1402)-N(4))-methyltransferase [bacterium DOLJORAL78_65_58]